MKIESRTRNHRKLRGVARRLGLSMVTIRGHMLTLWLSVLDESPDGDLSAFDTQDIESAAEWDGEPGLFVGALVEVGLLDQTEDGLRIHDWMDYAGNYREAKRKAAWRESSVPGQRQDVPSVSRPRGEERRREERRSENICAEPGFAASAPSVPEPATELVLIPEERSLVSSDPVVLEVPTVGGPPWRLLRSKVEEWSRAFPGLNVELEVTQAAQWCRDNPTRRKTTRGMSGFLFSWLSRQQNRRAPLYTPQPRLTAAEENVRRLRDLALNAEDPEESYGQRQRGPPAAVATIVPMFG